MAPEDADANVAQLSSLDPNKGATESKFAIRGTNLQFTVAVLFKLGTVETPAGGFDNPSETRIQNVVVPNLAPNEYFVFVKDNAGAASNELSFTVQPGV